MFSSGLLSLQRLELRAQLAEDHALFHAEVKLAQRIDRPGRRKPFSIVGHARFSETQRARRVCGIGRRRAHDAIGAHRTHGGVAGAAGNATPGLSRLDEEIGQ